MVFLGISSGLTRPQTIKGISNTSYLKQVLNNAENLYFIINTSFFIIGGYLYSLGSIQYVLLYILMLYIIYIIIILLLRRRQHENQH
ncbi:conserved hypothetical protein [Staphylococcus capitis]|nr:conserved hypothetical protein [Staphylococcus capitis]